MTALGTKKSDHIAQTLAIDIVHGHFEPGEKLRQDKIARDFGTSHVPVREALLHLEAQGLAISLPRRGMCVSPLDRKTIHELRLMRQALEPLALSQSIPQLTPEQIATADAARLRCDTAQTVLEWEEANRAFHLAIIAGCDMPRLINEINNLQLLYARHFLALSADRWRQREDADHKAIITAIEGRNVPVASAILQRHLSRMA